MKALRAALEAHERGGSAALVTTIGVEGSAPRSTGARMLVHADGSIVGSVGGGEWERQLIEVALDAIGTGKPRRFSVHLTRDLGMCCGGAMEAYVEPLPVRDTLVIHGAGHVGTAVARLARSLDFALLVCDERPEWTEPLEREGVAIHSADPRRTLDTLPFGPHVFHLVLTHSHALNQDLVMSLLPRDFAWLGMIGSRAKVAKFCIRMRAAGIDEALLSRLSAPVGLDIGAETPEEIAVSILAELVRVRRGVDRTPLPLSDIPIEARGGDGRAHVSKRVSARASDPPSR